MDLMCLVDYTYGERPRLTAKQAKDMDFSPQVHKEQYNGGPVQVFKAGEIYNVDDALARRLLRDHGAKRGRTLVRFEPTNPNDLMRILMGEADKVSLADVMARGFVVGDENGVGKESEVSVV